MPIAELVVRYRCAVCSVAIEHLTALNLPQLPANLQGITLPVLPAGWGLSAEGAVECDRHHVARRIIPATVVPRIVN